MRKLMYLVCVCLAAFPLCGQSPAKYEVAAITDVKTHQDSSSEVVSYDVSVKVGDTLYVVLYTPPPGMNAVKYAAGRELLVLVGKKTITYNDMLGQLFEVPIVSHRSVAKQQK